MNKDTILTILILLSLLLGVLWGQFGLFDASVSDEVIAQTVQPYQEIGDLVFIRPLRMMIIPLVFVSVVVGVCAIGDPERLGLLGGATLAYYFTTMAAAVILGQVLVNITKPGVGADPTQYETAAVQAYATKQVSIEAGQTGGVGGAFQSLLQDMIPTNPIAAAANGSTLGMVTVGIVFGIALVMTRDPARPVIVVFEGMFQAMIKLVTWIIWLAPIGIFFIVSAKVGQTGFQKLAGPIGLYGLTVVLGLLIHMLITLPLILWLLGRTNPYGFLVAVRKPLLMAFSTASSSATLPVTIEECQKKGGCSKRAANFVLPLGATVNMDGTALYQAVAVTFLFQMFGVDLTLTQQMSILITAVLAAVGAAGIPSAGLVTMAIVIGAVNQSLVRQGLEPMPLWTIMIILGVDRILDMCRTAVNVWGDAVGARLITRLAPDTDDERAQALA
ncbi:MAG: dicarboxylate/amino acid:cation symporter [Phycisphaerales bacterium]|nr:dicarboxylate/amino acid:cation symporter [Phycisphaerales bacterium]